jgi:transposase
VSPETTPVVEAKQPKPKYRPLNREQGLFTEVYIDRMIGADHPARLIWELVGGLDLSQLGTPVASFEKEVGRPRWQPQLLVSVLVYGYTLGTGSARELQRLMGWEPGLRWLCALDEVNHHTLSDFRMQEGEKLKGLLAQVLALLASEELVNFNVLMQDGTKMKTVAGRESFRREKTVQQHLVEAQACVDELDRQAAEETGSPAARSRKEGATQRAARERLERMTAAAAELKQRQAAAKPGEREEMRVSETEPEARKMKHPHGGFEPSYNLQLITEGGEGFITGVVVSNAVNDLHQLEPGLAASHENTQQQPQIVVADGGYASRENVEQLDKLGIELVSPWKSAEKREAGALVRAGIQPAFAPSRFVLAPEGEALVCPAGSKLVHIKTGKHHGVIVQRYQAEAAVCGACPHKPACCPSQAARMVERVVESEAMERYHERMAKPDTQALYKKRARIAEYPNLKIKAVWKHGRFRVRGLVKAAKEAIWMALAFNLDLKFQLMRTRAAAVAA